MESDNMQSQHTPGNNAAKAQEQGFAALDSISTTHCHVTLPLSTVRTTPPNPDPALWSATPLPASPVTGLEGW